MRKRSDILAAIAGLEKVMNMQRLAGKDPEDVHVQMVGQAIAVLRWAAREPVGVPSFVEFIERLVADENKSVQ